MPPIIRNEQDVFNEDFSNQDLNGSEFFKASLTDVLFVNTKLRGTDFRESNWLNVDASGAIFAPNSNFPDVADLSLATLENVDFSGANLKEANLFKVNIIDILPSRDARDSPSVTKR